MNYQYTTNKLTDHQTDHRKPLGEWKKPGYDVNPFKFSFETTKDTLNDSISFASPRISTEHTGLFSGDQAPEQTLFCQQDSTKNHYYNSAQPVRDQTQTQQRLQIPIMLLERSGQPEKQLFYQQTLHKAGHFRQELTAQKCFQDDCSKLPEHEPAGAPEAACQQPAYQPFAESFRNMTIHDLIDQCQDHVCVINTCNMLQKIITEELFKQVKLDDIVCQKLTARAQRLQQQFVFLEKVQAPSWVKAALDDLSIQVTHRAQAHKTHAADLLKECETIQCSMDESQEVVKTTAAAAGRSQDTKDDEESRVETSLNSTQMSKTSDDAEDKLRYKSFLQINDTFEGIRKPWMKLLSLLEYQQEHYLRPMLEEIFKAKGHIKTMLRKSLSEMNLESYMSLSIEKELLNKLDTEAIIDRFAQSSRYDATLTQIEQVENEIEKLLSNEEVDNSPWRTQIKKKDFETRKELLEARKDHLETDVSSAKKDISDFELKNRDSILDVLNALRQHRNRCDTILRENFQLLKTASLRDPTCFRQHSNKSDPGVDGEQDCDNKQTSVSGKPLDSWSGIHFVKDNQRAAQMFGGTNCIQEKSCAPGKKQIHDFCQIKINAVPDTANNADFIAKPPPRDLKGSNFQNQSNFYSYMLLSDNESGLSSKANIRDMSPFEVVKGRYVNTKDIYRADGYKSSSSDFNVSRANKDSPVSTTDEAAGDERMDAVVSPVCNDDSKTTSWSISSSQGEQQCHPQFKSHVFTSEKTDKTSQLTKDDRDKHPYTDLPSLYQDICGREYNCHRFPLGVTEHSPSMDVYKKDVPNSLRFFKMGLPVPDVLSSKEVRAAYFINKYARGRHTGRSFLVKNMDGIRPLAMRGTKDYAVKKLGRGYHESGNKTNYENMTKRSSNKRKKGSTTGNDSSEGLDLEQEDSTGSQDVYSDNSVADDDNIDLQLTSLDNSK